MVGGRGLLAVVLILGLAAGLYVALRGRGAPSARIELSSPAFEDREVIPAKYTCDSEDVPPPLEWRGLPEGTVPLAMIAFDPDAQGGEFTHWLIHGIPADVRSLPKGVPCLGVQGRNDFGEIGYGGPCPPSGPAHRHAFRLLALDADLDLPTGAGRAGLEEALEGHVLGMGELVGLYSRH